MRARLTAPAAAETTPLAWTSVYSQVSGLLPLDALPRFDAPEGAGALSVARCHLDVKSGGKIDLRMNSTTGLTLWLDGLPVEFRDRLRLDLQRGRHTLTFAVDRTKRQEGLCCELADSHATSARADFVGGK